MTFDYTDELAFDSIVVERDNIKYWQRQFAARRDLIGSPLVADILFEYYTPGDNERFYSAHVSGEELNFPVLMEDDWANVSFDPDNLIKSFTDEYDTEYDRSFIWETAMQRAALTVDATDAPVDFRVRDYVWNNPIYKIDSIQTTSDGFEFDVALTDYYTYVSRAIKLVEELFEVLDYRNVQAGTPTEDALDALQFSSDFSKRDYYAPNLNSLKADSSHHLLGSIVTTLIEHNDEVYVAVMNRSETTVDFPSAKGVAPSGAFYPVADSEAECQYRTQLLGLVGDELFTIEPPVTEPENISPDWMLEEPMLDELNTLLDTDGAHTRITGLGFNCLNTAPQVSALLYIDDEEYTEKLFEKVQSQTEEDLEEGTVQFVPLEETLENLGDEKWAPGAAVSLLQGTRAATEEFELDIETSVI